MAALLALAAGLLTERRVRAAPVGSWMLDPSDDYGRLTSIVMQGAEQYFGQPSVFILGASDTREILATESGLNRLAKAAGCKARIVTLCGDGLLLEERAALLDQLKPSARGAIVLGVNLTQFCRSGTEVARIAQRYRLGFRSPIFDQEAELVGAKLPEPTGLFFYDNRLFFLRRTIGLIGWAHKNEYLEHRALNQLGDLHDPWQFRRIHHFSAEEFARNSAVIARLVERLRRNGGPRVVLLEVPSIDYIEPALGGPNHARELELYRSAVRKFAERQRLPYLDPAPTSGLSPKSFQDFAHVGDDSARERFSAQFIRQLQQIISPPHT